VATPSPVENKNITTARELVEKTQHLAQKIAEAKAVSRDKEASVVSTAATHRFTPASIDADTALSDRVEVLVGSAVTDGSAQLQAEKDILQQFNAQFEHFGDDAPACDVCGSITVRNGTCYKCYNCGNSMGCS